MPEAKVGKVAILLGACELPFVAFRIGLVTFVTCILSSSAQRQMEGTGWVFFMINPSRVERALTGLLMMSIGTLLSFVATIFVIYVIVRS